MPSILDTVKGISTSLEDDLSCFSAETEEFYKTSTPSEDIWKKFDFLTPPLSPDNEVNYELALPTKCEQSLCIEEELDDISWTGPHCSDVALIREGLKTELRHDCMWSGRCSEICCRKSNLNVVDISRATTVDRAQVSRNKQTYRPLTPLEELPRNCINPSSVLPCNAGPFLSDHSYFQPVKGTPASSRSENNCKENFDALSDSDEEIDVVSVDKVPQLTTSNQLPRRLACGIRKGRLVLTTQPVKRLVPDSSSKNTGFSSNSVVPVKSKKKSANGAEVRCCDSISRTNLHVTDFEDPVRRKEHNSMERKRRDELRSAFQSLREQVPDLRDNPKAPKVVILKRATAYTNKLTSSGEQLERTVQALIRRRSKLQRRLQRLQKSTLTI
ncbi:transcriptional regulator Myc-A-like [Tachypleus tridentatus]|uniref:transcriptional regulator Myc-A-like n=1 Tax=Tachypleus tridentatus TaxID=6853 RepID=UPI003FD3DB34